MIVYLIHFTRPYRHAQHYIGSTENLIRRTDQHLRERTHLMGAVNKAGIPWLVARTWEVDSRELEYQLKAWKKSSDLCPICRALAGKTTSAILPLGGEKKQSPEKGISLIPPMGDSQTETIVLS